MLNHLLGITMWTCASRCESWWACWSSGCESWCAMLYQWSWIMESYAQPVVVNHVVLCLANGCKS
jgi:hypothetical protein